MKALWIAAAVSLVSTPTLAGGSVEAGKAKSQTCAACHGADGNTPIDPSYPRLAGQYADYLLHALMDYKSGARKNAIMAGQAQPLSKQDMLDLAAYFASLPGGLSTRTPSR